MVVIPVMPSVGHRNRQGPVVTRETQSKTRNPSTGTKENTMTPVNSFANV